MTNQVAVIVEERVENDCQILRESENYFDQIVAIESKDLKFYFNEHKNDANLIFCYFLQVCPHQQNLSDLSKNINKPITGVFNDKELPPRILQNVHGYFEIGSQRTKTFGSEKDCACDQLPTRYFSNQGPFNLLYFLSKT